MNTQPIIKCPKCNAPMRKRNGSRGEFYGCSTYPNCKGTRDISYMAPEPIRDSKVWKDEPKEQDKFNLNEKKQTKREALAAKLIAQGATPPQPKKEFAPSKYQQAIFDWVEKAVKKDVGSALVVEALAGSGKTTTGVKIMELLPTDFVSIFLAFNKRIAVELTKRAPKHVKVSTYHSLGYAACRDAWGNNIQVDDYKCANLLEGVLDKYTNKHLYPAILQLVGLVKNTLSGVSEEELFALADYHGIELNGDSDTVFLAVQMVLERDANQTAIIDYDDMIWLPVYHNLVCKKYDCIIVDEEQDSNKCQIELVKKSMQKNGIFIGVGDSHQSLYGFRGADVDAVKNIIEAFNAEVLPLSITYRNPKCVVELVNKEFPSIPLEGAPNAKPGAIRQVTEERALVEYTPGDMVVCRTNAPLVEPAFALIRKGVKAVIVGRDIGKGLITLIRKMKALSLPDLLRKLDEYKVRESEKLLAANKNNQAQSLADKVETITALADGITTIGELEDKVELIFKDDVEGVAFSSVHRAKGLEAERVYILHPELLPHPMAKKSWEMLQEQNIRYVAYTRTLNELIFVGG